MSRPLRANISVRLPREIIAALEAEKTRLKERSITEVLDTKLSIAEPPPSIVRQPKSVSRRIFSIRQETHQRLLSLADENGTVIGNVVFSMLQPTAQEIAA